MSNLQAMIEASQIAGDQWKAVQSGETSRTQQAPPPTPAQGGQAASKNPIESTEDYQKQVEEAKARQEKMKGAEAQVNQDNINRVAAASVAGGQNAVDREKLRQSSVADIIKKKPQTVSVHATTGKDVFDVRVAGSDTPIQMTRNELNAAGHFFNPEEERKLEVAWVTHDLGPQAGDALREKYAKEEADKKAATVKNAPEDVDPSSSPDYVQVGSDVTTGDPEYIKKSEYEKIKEQHPELAELLLKKGTKAYNAAININNEHAQADYEKSLSEHNKWLEDNIKSDKYLNGVLKEKGEDAAIEAFNKRQKDLSDIMDRQVNAPDYPPELRDAYNEAKKSGNFDSFNKAVDEYNAKVDQHNKEFNEKYVVIGDQGMLKEEYNKLSSTYKYVAITQGYDALFARMEEDQAAIDKTMKDLEPFKDKDGNYDLIGYLDGKQAELTKKTSVTKPVKGALGKLGVAKTTATQTDFTEEKQALINAGFDKKAVEDSIYQAKLDPVQRFWQASTPWNEQKGETANLGNSLVMASEWLVPFVYTGRHWNEMSTTGKVINLFVDAISIIGPAARGASVAGRSVAGVATRAGVMRAAAQGALRGAVSSVVPIDIIVHPGEAAAATVRDLRNTAEDLVDPHKLPSMSVYSSEGTVRLKIAGDITPAKGMKIRDQLMDAVKNGERVFIDLGDRTLELERSALMKELRPGSMAHATPMGDIFSKVLKVQHKPGMSPREQGLFISPDPLPRFARSSAFGKAGEQPTLFIMSPETAQKSVNTGKLYDSPAGEVAELERKIPEGEDVKPVGQKFYTRIGPEGTRVEIWLEEGNKLSLAQVAKLKAKGFIETIKAMYTPALKTSGKLKNLSKGEVEMLADELRRAGAKAEARNLERAGRLIAEAEATIPRITLRAGQEYKAITRNMGKTYARNDIGRTSVSRASVRNVETIKRTSKANRKADTPERPLNRTTDYTLQRGKLVENTRTGNRQETRSENARTTAKDTREQTREQTRNEAERTERTENIRNGQRVEEQRTELHSRINEPDRTRQGVERARDRVEVYPHENEGYGKLKGKGNDKEKREKILEAKYALGYRRGQLGGKDVWHTWINNGNEWERVIVIGKTPEGAEIYRGVKSAYKSMQKFSGAKGLPAAVLNEDTGAVDTRITLGKSSGKPQIEFSRDLNKGNPPITPRTPAITPRMPLISGKQVRISPRTPRITPRTPRIS